MKITKSHAVVFLYCIYIANCVFSESHLIDFQFIDFLLTLVRYGVIVVLFTLFLSNAKSSIKREIFIPLLIVVSSALINMIFCGGGTSFISILIISITFRQYNIKSDRLFINTIKTLIITNLIVIILCFDGFIEDTIGLRVLGSEIGKFFEGSYVRHSYGFLTANQLPLTLLIIYILRIAYKREKMKLIEHIIFAVMDFIFFRIFGSRAAFILLALAIILYFWGKYLLEKKKKRRCFAWIIYPVCAAISIFLSVMYNSSSLTWRYINNVLMNRITMSNNALKQYGVTLFGNGISAIYTWNDTMSNFTTSTLDNGYVSLLVQRGIIIFVCVLFVWCTLTYRAQKNGNIYLLFGLLILAIANIIDSHLLSYKVIPYFCLYMELNSELLESSKLKLLKRKLTNIKMRNDIYAN